MNFHGLDKAGQMHPARRIQTFQAIDQAGRSYRINEMQEYDGAGKVTSKFITSDQRPVERLAKGRYRIVAGSIELKAVDPETAP